eukprot:c19663_g1_i1 orf=201-2285(+)
MGDLVVSKHQKLYSKPDDLGANGEVEDMTLRDKQDDGENSVVTEMVNGEGNHFVHSDSAKSYADADAMGADMDSTNKLNMQGARTDDVFDSCKTDGFQELLQLAQEYESEGASKEGVDNGCHPQNEGFSEGYSPEQKVEQNICVKEDVNSASNQKASLEVSYFEEAGLKNNALERGISSSCSFSQTKAVPTGDQRNFQSKEDQRNFQSKEVQDIGQACASGNRRSSRSASLTSITIGPSRSHFTIPQPFSLATDRRAVGGGRPRDDETGQLIQKAHGLNGDPHLKTPEISRKLSAKLHVAKSVRSESIKHQADNLKKLTIRANPEDRDDDTISISSIQSAAPKAKASRFTSTSSFKFQSDARAEKRKEYYSKLQERLSAKEEEINQMQAKAKKEREKEIKLLRRSLTFKASPMPTFYQEGPPPQAELPRTPTTRAKSPNFSRRDSHSGFGGSTRLCKTIRCDADHRSSLSPQRPGKGNNAEVLDNDDCNQRFVNATSLSEEELTEGKTFSSSGALELLDAQISVVDGAFEDMPVKVRDPLTVSSELMMSDEEEKAHIVPYVESTHITSNGEGDKVHFDKIKPIKCKETSPVMDSFGRPDYQAKRSNVLKGHGNVNAGVLLSNSNKTKADRKVQPLAHNDSEDLSANVANKSIKKQRLKALTPYFRKRESSKNEGQSTANKETPYTNSNVTVGSE